MNPGATTSPRASSVSRPASGSDVTAAMRPPAIPTLRTASRPVSGSRTRPPTRTTSNGRKGSGVAQPPSKERISRSRFMSPILPEAFADPGGFRLIHGRPVGKLLQDQLSPGTRSPEPFVRSLLGHGHAGPAFGDFRAGARQEDLQGLSGR